jgi:hypothetical protein
LTFGRATFVACTLCLSASLNAQDSAVVVPGAEYAISGPLGWLDQWLFGKRYRDLWTDSIRAPVLRLPSAVGGLQPLSADTGLRAGDLNLRAHDGSPYLFRLSNPPLSQVVASDLRLDAITGPIQDLVSGLHPGAPLVVPPLARAAGVGDRPSEMGVLAADSALGALSVTFANQLGFLRPASEGRGALTTGALIARIRAGEPLRVDARAYLRDRLFDIYVGEAEFFPAEGKWHARGDPPTWTPNAHDRDLAFARFDGIVTALARVAVPTFLMFGPKYDKSLGETAYSLAVDRQLLGALDWPAWDSAALAMRDALTDAAIDSAVATMPAAWRTRNGASLTSALRARRDKLPDAARMLYLLVAKFQDLYASAAVESILVERRVAGDMRVTMPGVDRVFRRTETAQVNLFLRGTHQVVQVRGEEYGGPTLQVIAGVGAATIVDSSTAAARTLTVVDPHHVTRIDSSAAGAPPAVSRTAVAPPDVTPSATGSAARPADGVRYGPLIWLDVFGDLGLLVGGGVERIRYEHGYEPYRSRQSLRAGYATKPNEYAVEYEGDFHFGPGNSTLRLNLSRSGLGLLKFYGFGNETVRDQSDQFYSSGQVQYLIAPAVAMPISVHDTLVFGPVYKDVSTSQSGDRYITITKPYGYPEFREAGIRGRITRDTRDSPVAAQSGWYMTAAGDFYPAVLDAISSFGGVQGAVSTYITPGSLQELTFAVRVAGQKVWGIFPVFEAAYLGGITQVRGLRPQRYAGDASAWGNFEARLKLAPLPFVVRWDFGVLAFSDVGRVFLHGTHSEIWHAGVGGGVFALLPDRSALLYLTLAHADNTWALDAGTKFTY